MFLPDTEVAGHSRLFPPHLLPIAHLGAFHLQLPAGLSAAFAGLDHPFLLMLFQAGTLPRPGGQMAIPHGTTRGATLPTPAPAHMSLRGTSEAQPRLACWAGSRRGAPWRQTTSSKGPIGLLLQTEESISNEEPAGLRVSWGWAWARACVCAWVERTGCQVWNAECICGVRDACVGRGRTWLPPCGLHPRLPG